jgi:hypothetical protein
MDSIGDVGIEAEVANPAATGAKESANGGGESLAALFTPEQDGLFAVGGIIVTGVRFFYFYT